MGQIGTDIGAILKRRITMTISERVFERLKQISMSQKEFSERTGIKQSTISEWKKNKTNPSSDKILGICQVLDVSADYILFGKRSKKQMTSLTDKISRLSERDYQMLMQFIDRLI